MIMLTDYLGFIPTICAMNTAATASYRAVPSMLIVAPIGRMNLEILESTLQPCSKLFTVTGKVAELLAVPKAVARAGPIWKFIIIIMFFLCYLSI